MEAYESSVTNNLATRIHTWPGRTRWMVAIGVVFSFYRQVCGRKEERREARGEWERERGWGWGMLVEGCAKVNQKVVAQM